jgi:hypothetical protein
MFKQSQVFGLKFALFAKQNQNILCFHFLVLISGDFQLLDGQCDWITTKLNPVKKMNGWVRINPPGITATFFFVTSPPPLVLI